MKKAVIYIRVSTQRQGASGLGLEAQKETCVRYVQDIGGEVIAEFSDVESGKSRTRNGLWKAIDKCKETGATLVVAKLDRLARDVEFTFKVVNTGIDIHFCDMPSVNTMVLGVFASVAQYERELICTRTKSALHAKKERGEQTGGTDALWGKNTHSDRREAIMSMVGKSADDRRARAKENPRNKFLWVYVNNKIKAVGSEAAVSWPELARELNELGQKTPTGLEFNTARVNSMYKKLKQIYGG